MTIASRHVPRPASSPAPTRIARLLAWLAPSDLRATGFLVAFAVLALLPGVFQLAPVDRDETRIVQTTKQMLETGNYVDLRFQNDIRYGRPVAIHWLQAASVRVAQALGVRSAQTRIWIYRIPSLLGAIGSVVLTYWAALAFMSRRRAVMAAVMMAACILLGIDARLARADAMHCLACIAAMGAMARAYLAGADAPQDQDATLPKVGPSAWTVPFVFWTAMAAGILLKGGAIVMVAGLPTLALAITDRTARWLARLKPLPGLAWMLILLAPWFVAVATTSGGYFAPLPFVQDFLRDLVARIGGFEDVHRAWPGFYFVLFWLTFFPGSILAGLAAPFVWRARNEPGVRFLLAWLIPSWIALELAMTKLPSYVLPLYPACAILIALAVERDALSRRGWLVRNTIWWFIVPSFAVLLGVIGAMVIGRQFAIAAWPLAGCVLVLSFLTWRLHDQDGAEQSILRAGAASILLATAFYAVLAPSLGLFFPSVALARTMNESGCRDPLAASVGFHEPSLVFLAGTLTAQVGAAEAADFLGGGACRFVFIDTRYERGFAQRADALGLRYASGPRFDAFNFGAGRAVTIAVYSSDVSP